jgi:hypothetical protein
VRWLETPRAYLWLTVIGLLLAAPSMLGRLVLDDHVLCLLARRDLGILGLHSSPLFLFSFTTGRPADNHALMDAGALLPWFTDEQHRNAFFRPLSSLTHLLDFTLWPNSPWLMHLHSLLWLCALLLAVAHVYRRLATRGSAVTTLAFALFVLDGAHGMTAAWIANRNALCAAALALPALASHHRWLAGGFKPGVYVGPACFALGLCAGETAVAVLGYLLAYTLVLDRAPVGRRLLHLAPYLALLALFGAVFFSLGLGSAGSGEYHDPVREPLGYALGLIQHLPVLLSAQLGAPLADVWFWGPPELHLPIWWVSVATLLALGLASHVLLSDDREARFWTLGMVLSGCAVAASVPSERLLLVPGIGGAVLVARLIWKLLPNGVSNSEDGQEVPDAMPIGSRAWRLLLLAALVFWRLIVCTLLWLILGGAMNVLGSAIDRIDRDIPATPDITSRTVIVVNAPFDTMLSYLQVAREARGTPRPAHLYWLASASSRLALETLDERTLRVRPARGFLLMPIERHYRSDPRALAVGASVSLSEMTVRVLAVTPDGRPAAADFRFREPLSSPSYLLRRWERGRLLPFVPPSRGQIVHLPREDFFRTLFWETLDLARGR